jgi:REP element-mobilizing transposase RayT
MYGGFALAIHQNGASVIRWAWRFAGAKPPYTMLLFSFIFILLRGFFMPNYWRNFVAGGCYFFTVNLLERKQSLLTAPIDLLRDPVRKVKRLYPFHINVWVVLPEHMHCVWTLPPDTDDFPVPWRLIKLLFSKGLPRTERLSAKRRKRSERAYGNGAIGNIRLQRNWTIPDISTMSTLIL